MSVDDESSSEYGFTYLIPTVNSFSSNCRHTAEVILFCRWDWRC